MTEQSAQQNEAEDVATVDVDYGGHTYTMASTLDDVSGDAIDALEEGHVGKTLRALLGEEQWKAFKAPKPHFREYKGLFSAWAELAGLDSAGN